MWEVSDETLVEVDKPYEWLDFGHILGGWPVSDTSDFDHYMTFWEDEAEVFDHGLFEGALLHFEVEMVLTEDVKDSYYNLVMLLFGLSAEDKDVIHHHLKGGRAIC